jgi:hypothetical protein
MMGSINKNVGFLVIAIPTTMVSRKTPKMDNATYPLVTLTLFSFFIIISF